MRLVEQLLMVQLPLNGLSVLLKQQEERQLVVKQLLYHKQ